MRLSIDRRATRLASALLLAAALSLGLSATSVTAGGPGNPGGNNGTVKVHESDTSAEVMRNEPHVCSFYLAFFSSDAAQGGDWEIRGWSPSGDGAVVASGTYLTDAEGFYRTEDMVLPDGHYRVYWQGINDKTWKHKMFWVDCADEAESGAETDQPPASGEEGSQGGAEGSQGGGAEGAAAAGEGGPGQGELPDTAMEPPAMEPLNTGGTPVAIGILLVTMLTALAAERRRQSLS